MTDELDGATIEYGIRHKRYGNIHRDGMTHEKAVTWMKEDWGELDPTLLYEIVCRPIGKWRPAGQPDIDDKADG